MEFAYRYFSSTMWVGVIIGNDALLIDCFLSLPAPQGHFPFYEGFRAEAFDLKRIIQRDLVNSETP